MMCGRSPALWRPLTLLALCFFSVAASSSSLLISSSRQHFPFSTVSSGRGFDAAHQGLLPPPALLSPPASLSSLPRRPARRRRLLSVSAFVLPSFSPRSAFSRVPGRLSPPLRPAPCVSTRNSVCALAACSLRPGRPLPARCLTPLRTRRGARRDSRFSGTAPRLRPPTACHASKGGSTSLCGAAQAAEAEEEVAAATHDAWGGVRRFTDALGIPENRFIHFGSAFTPAAGEALAQELLALQTDGSGLPLCLCINSSGSELLLDGSLVSPFDSDWQAAVALLRGRLLLQLPPPLSPAAEAPPRGCAAPVAAGLRPSLATVAMGRAWGTAALLLACGAPGARAATRNTSIALRFPRVSLGRGTARELRERARAILAGQRFQAELLAAVLSSGRRHPAEVQRALHVKTASLARWEGSREAAGGVTANLGEAAASGKEDAIGSFPGVTGSPRGLEPGQYSGEDERGKDRRDEREQGGRGDAEGLGEAGSCADALLALMRKGTFLTAEQAWQMGIIDYIL